MADKIKMSTEADFFSFDLTGYGVVTVDWGDGSEKLTKTLNEFGESFRHPYSNTSLRTITINGDNITVLMCYGVLANLDVSHCTELLLLNVDGSQLTSLDMSENTALAGLNVRENGFSAAALNALFDTLHNNTGEDKNIEIRDNPGADDCDRSIAERKGWSFL